MTKQGDQAAELTPFFSTKTFINPQSSSTMAGCEEYSIGYYTKTA